MIALLNVLLVLLGLPLLVAPIALIAFRELAPARTNVRVFAFGGGWS